MTGSETSGEFELKVFIAVVGGSAAGKKILPVVEAALGGIAGVGVHRHARPMISPCAFFYIESLAPTMIVGAMRH